MFLPDIIKSPKLCKIHAEALVLMHKEYNLILFGIVAKSNTSEDSSMLGVCKIWGVIPRNFMSHGGFNLNYRILYNQIQEYFLVRLFYKFLGVF